jgi:hypothetical protein
MIGFLAMLAGAVVGGIVGLSLIVWLLLPIWLRPRTATAPIPTASIAGHVAFETRPRRRPMTTAEAVRVACGLVALVIAIGVIAGIVHAAQELAELLRPQ